MIKVIGSYDCSRCKAVQNILVMKGVEFKYKELSEVEDKGIKEVYNNIIDTQGSIQLPLILDGSNNVLELQSII